MTNSQRRSEAMHSSKSIKIHEHDVLGGKGHGTNRFPGNQFYLKRILAMKSVYLRQKTHKAKAAIAREIIHSIQSRSPPGRFLKKNKSSNEWEVIPLERVEKKIKQALRDIDADSCLETVNPPPHASANESLHYQMDKCRKNAISNEGQEESEESSQSSVSLLNELYHDIGLDMSEDAGSNINSSNLQPATSSSTTFPYIATTPSSCPTLSSRHQRFGYPEHISYTNQANDTRLEEATSYDHDRHTPAQVHADQHHDTYECLEHGSDLSPFTTQEVNEIMNNLKGMWDDNVEGVKLPFDDSMLSD